MGIAVVATVAGLALLPASPVMARTWAFAIDDCMYYVRGDDENRDGMLSLSETDSSWLECPDGGDDWSYYFGGG